MKDRLHATMLDTADETPIKLTEAEKKVGLMLINKLVACACTLRENIEEDRYTKGNKVVYLSLLESYLGEVHKELDYASVLATEKDLRVKDLRNANTEIHELKKRLGDKVSTDDIRQAIKRLTEKISYWWKYEGFGHISDIHFLEHCVKVKLSCSLTYPEMFCKNSKMTDKDWLQSLRDKGFEFAEKPKGHVHRESPLLTENTFFAFRQLVLKTFPTALITRVETLSEGKGPTQQQRLWTIEMLIYDLNEIEKISMED